jgi:alkaline phosphatase D
MASVLSVGWDSTPPPARIAFGSCAHQMHPQPIWSRIGAQDPDLFVMLGDNIYADTDDMKVMAACYRRFGGLTEFAQFRRKIPVLATWDDHDYGRNDSGREYPFRQESKEFFLNFFGEPVWSARRRRPGVYTSYMLGRPPYNVQIILLDLRWFRTSLCVTEGNEYCPTPDVHAELLGSEQWQWLERQLMKPAGARIIGSSVQFIAAEHRWEKWSNFPLEKLKLERMLETLNIRNAVVISGDMHFAEISSQALNNGFELAEFTASGLSHSEPANGIPNSRRLSLYDQGTNFGLITVDWNRGKITGEILDERAKVKGYLDVPIPVHMFGA